MTNLVIIESLQMPIRQDENQPNRRFGIINLILIGFGALLLFSSFFPSQNTQVPRVPYSLFINQVDDGEVKRAYITQEQIRYELSSVEDGAPSVLATTPIFDMELPQRLEKKGVEFAAAPPKKPNIFTTILSWVVPPLIFILVLQFFARRSMGGGGAQGALSFTKSKAKVYVPDDESKVTFDDVAGVDEAKDELTEIVDFLKKPQRYTDIGARIPKGVLLVGPPGTGKTLLAKAIAGEAGVPFFSLAGSEFVEMFVGVGASRVRDLFKKAKENSPCLIFIDEIDAVGRQRGAGIGGGNDEREQTLNQLLTEMDGFEGNSGIIIIAATNRPDVLDSALMRPGRFDRQVTVDAPDIKGRLSILEVHSKNKTLQEDLTLESIARRTPGFTGADLANLLNEAAILTARRRKESIGILEIDDSVDRIVAGMEGSPLTDGRSKRLIAYHEVGHAIIGTLVKAHDPVQKVTVIPRGQAKGLTWFTPDDDQSLISRANLKARIMGALGGRAAEDVVFGKGEITTGAGGDFQQVASMARQMVTRFGMSELGPIALEGGNQEVFVGRDLMTRSEVSDSISKQIDESVRVMVKDCYKQTYSIISKNREAMDKIVDLLIEKETLDGEEFVKILSEFTQIPEKERTPQILN